MLNILCLTNEGRLRFIGRPCRDRLQCEHELLAIFRETPNLERAQFFTASLATRRVHKLHPHYISNVGWLAAKLRVDQQDFREGAWLDLRRRPLTLTAAHREHLAFSLAQSLAGSLLEDTVNLTPELLGQELVANWPQYLKFAGVPRRSWPAIQKKFESLLDASCNEVGRKARRKRQ